jgi:hypothetical protein
MKDGMEPTSRMTRHQTVRIARDNSCKGRRNTQREHKCGVIHTLEFVLYLTTLSVTLAIWRRMTRWTRMDRRGRGYQQIYDAFPVISWRNWRKSRYISISMVDVMADIRTRHLSNRSQKRTACMNLRFHILGQAQAWPKEDQVIVQCLLLVPCMKWAKENIMWRS